MTEPRKIVLFDGRHLRLVERDGWEYVERKTPTGIVAIVALTPGGGLLLVEQFRPAVGRTVVELPAGLAGDVPGHEKEELSLAARRELIEETGYDAEGFDFLSEGPPSPGATSEVVTFFRARGLTRVGSGGGDATERILVHEVAPREVEAFLSEKERQGALVDPKVFIGLYFLRG